MTKVHIVEKFKTSFRTVIVTDENRQLSVGEKIICDDNREYIIKGFHMPTKRTDDADAFGIIV